MAYRLIFLAVQAIFLQTVYSQCLNRVPNCGPVPLEAYLPLETFGPNQLIIGQGLPLLPIPNYAPFQSLYSELATPTVIQDSTVSNNLANTLQLLVVSNLLSSTLPGGNPYFLEPCSPVPPIGPYNYFY